MESFKACMLTNKILTQLEDTLFINHSFFYIENVLQYFAYSNLVRKFRLYNRESKDFLNLARGLLLWQDHYKARFNITYYISWIDLVSRMINIGKLDGKGEDEIWPIDGFIYSSPERDKSCARHVARSRRVPFSAGEARSLSLLLLRLGTYNKYHISFQLLPIFSPALRYRRRIWRRSLWAGRGAIERWVMAPIKQTLRVRARARRNKLFFRSRFSIYRPSSKFSAGIARHARIFLG